MSSRPERATVTVVLCTHNRSDRLVGSCESVLRERCDRELLELIVVDSASTDDTPSVIESIARRFPRLCRGLRVDAPGLSRARNAGIAAAKGDVVAFLDDDAWARPGWVAALVEAFEATGADAVGGPVSARLEGSLPAWFCGSMLPYLSVWERAPERRELEWPELPRGTNMAFRRSTFEEWGGFVEDLGRRGRNLASCEEIELFVRLARGGRRIVYEPEAIVEHELPAARLSKRYMRRRFRAQGASEAVMHWRLGGWRGLREGWRLVADYRRSGRHDPGAWARTRDRCRALSALGYAAAALSLVARPPWKRPAPPESMA